jgi:hypothetical protein
MKNSRKWRSRGASLRNGRHPVTSEGWVPEPFTLVKPTGLILRVAHLLDSCRAELDVAARETKGRRNLRRWWDVGVHDARRNGSPNLLAIPPPTLRSPGSQFC